uniref:CSON002238 protein n=1 Tax=Culicoides sonorensis TaxID=179676 RepID=A0A336ML43_CULSO
MKCSINGVHIKVFNRAIQYLSKIGDEIHFETFATGLCLSAVSSRKTAFGSIKFDVDFFTEYEDDLGKDDESQCKVSVKSILPLFRSLKQFESGTISLDRKNCKLIFKFICRQKLIKRLSIPILEFSRIDDLIIPENFSNKIAGSHKVMNNILSNFHKTTREISFDVTNSSIEIKNHIDNPDLDFETVRANYKLRIDEFETFSIKNPCNIAFSYSDFRAMVKFVDESETHLRINFESPGEPMCLSTRIQDMLVANLLIATLLHDMEETGQDEIQSNSDKTSQTSDIPVAKVTKKNASMTRNRRVIKTQEEDNPFNFIDENRTPSPQVVRNENEQVPEPRPTIIPCSSSSNISDTIPNSSKIYANRPSSLTDIPIQRISEAREEPMQVDSNPEIQIQENEVQQKPDQLKASEEIFFETEESESNKAEIVPESEESVPASPTAEFRRRRRHIFRRCFEQTFDPRTVPGANEILAVNSDEEG